MSTTKMPCYYISHGGPTLVIDKEDESYQWMQRWGKSIIKEIKPKAIVVLSAHWETTEAIRVTNFSGKTPIIYDFYGFPEILYKQTYDGKGSPVLAKRIVDLLNQAGFQSELDDKRGFDHGCWIPLKVAIPEPGDLPIIQVSLTRKASYEHHIKVGRVLASLRNEGIIIIGSGSLVHNLRETFATLDKKDFVAPYVGPFESDIEKLCTKFTGKERDQKLIDLINHPLLRKAHPTDDHLVPLHIAAGVAGDDQGTKLHTKYFSALSMSAIGFGVTN
ncbi:2458_t:CDS:2 [Funneliformis mosseae]|uniref:2458_t:CDS:1 n=1 Tax=Funneliformis mosseae TaxID=27381 RepID=A0A9N8V7N1_FUNMO|nr:2458_t:CDS:2 [Funneliformis mosseae]